MTPSPKNSTVATHPTTNSASKKARHIIPTEDDLLLAISDARRALGKDAGVCKLRNAIMQAKEYWIVDTKAVRKLRKRVADGKDEDREEQREEEEINEQRKNNRETAGISEEKEEKPTEEVSNETLMEKLIHVLDLHAEQEAYGSDGAEYTDAPELQEEEHDSFTTQTVYGDSHGTELYSSTTGEERPHNNAIGGVVYGNGMQMGNILPSPPDVPASLSLLEAILRARLDDPEADAESVAQRVSRYDRRLLATGSMVEEITGSGFYRELYNKYAVDDRGAYGGDGHESRQQLEVEMQHVLHEELSDDEDEEDEDEEVMLPAEEPKTMFLLRAMLEAGYELGPGASATDLARHIVQRHETWIVDEERVEGMKGEMWDAQPQPGKIQWTVGHVGIGTLSHEGVMNGGGTAGRSFKERLMMIKEEEEEMKLVSRLQVEDGMVKCKEDEEEWKAVALHFFLALLLSLCGAVIFAMFIGLDGGGNSNNFRRGSLYGNYSGPAAPSRVNVVVPASAIGRSSVLIDMGGGRWVNLVFGQ